MALIVISVSDTADGQVGVSMIAEPPMDLAAEVDQMTPAQLAALSMINVMQSNDQPTGTTILNQ
jgi:hypothetical protein